MDALHRWPSASVMPAGPGPGQSSVPELGPWDACRGPTASLLLCSRSRGLTLSVFSLPSPSPPCPPPRPAPLIRPHHSLHHLQWDPTVGEAQGLWGGGGRGSRDTQQRTVPRACGPQDTRGGGLFCWLWVISEAVGPVSRVTWLRCGHGG